MPTGGRHLPSPLSLWTATAAAPDRRDRLLPPEVDVAVLGGGIAGLTTAYLLALEGRSVLVLEAREIASGVSGHTTAKLTAQHALKYHLLERRKGPDAAACYAESQWTALEWVTTTADELDIDCDLLRLDSFVYTTDAARTDHLRVEADAAAQAGLPASFVDGIDLDVGAAGAVRFTRQAQFHPRRWLLGLAAAIDALGGTIVEGVRALAVDERGGPRISTSHGDVTARDVVVATHYPVLDRGLYFARLDPVRDLVVAGPVPPQRVPQGMYLDERTHHSVRGYTSNGTAIAIAGGEHYRTGAHVDVAARYRRLAGWASDHLGLGRITYLWSAHDLSTPDAVPYVGRYHPFARHLWVATGFGQWGMTGGTAAGLLLRDLITTGNSPAAWLYEPSREHVRSAPSVTKDNITVAAYFLGDRLRALATSTQVDDLPVGHGRVTRLGTTMAAVCREPDGTLRAVHARCTHLGCLVAFNNAERTWDCPCHGSRFAPDGSVLQGPATEPLSPVEHGSDRAGDGGGRATPAVGKDTGGTSDDRCTG